MNRQPPTARRTWEGLPKVSMDPKARYTHLDWDKLTALAGPPTSKKERKRKNPR